MQHRRTGRLGQQLGLAGTLHGDEPPDGLVHRVADGEKPVVAKDDSLVVAEGGGDALALFGVDHHAGVVVEEPVVLVEGADVLGDGVESAAQAGPRLAVDRVGVGGGHHVGPGRVDLGVDGEGGPVDGAVAFHDLALGIDADEVGDRDVAEVDGEGIHPEELGVLGVTGGDVPGHALVEAELGEEPETGGQTLLAVLALLLDGVEDRGSGDPLLGQVLHCHRHARLLHPRTLRSSKHN